MQVFVADDVTAGETNFAVTVTNGPSWGEYEIALAPEVSGPARDRGAPPRRPRFGQIRA